MPVTRDAVGQLNRCETLFQDFCIVTESVRHGSPVSVSVRAHDSAPAR